VQASKALFRRRNSQSSLLQGTVDLHGLHIQEATYTLTTLIDLYRRYTTISNITIVTGTGHHSSQGRVKLLPAIIELVDSMQIKYKKVKDKSGYVGGLVLCI
jgi:DNA-nicking Smr family endonuclease